MSCRRFQGPVHPLDTPEREIVSSSSALVLTDALVRDIISEMPNDNDREKSDELKYLLKITYSLEDRPVPEVGK